jgi:hypothetical protein
MSSISVQFAEKIIVPFVWHKETTRVKNLKRRIIYNLLPKKRKIKKRPRI